MPTSAAVFLIACLLMLGMIAGGITVSAACASVLDDARDQTRIVNALTAAFGLFLFVVIAAALGEAIAVALP